MNREERMPNEYPANEYPTAEYQTLPVPENDYIDDDDEEWVSQAPTGLRIPPVTGILLLVLFAVCGLWGGAVLQKHHDKSTATSTGAAAFAAAAAGRRAGGAG
ncbi:MAG: hypothetical protein M3083_08355, partial [Actinomycetota bacterium]|nr:hypothetical protein [Actinomycetota bacterium]